MNCFGIKVCTFNYNLNLPSRHLTIKTLEQGVKWRCSGVFIVNFVLLLLASASCSSVSVVNFELDNAGWVNVVLILRQQWLTQYNEADY